MRTAITITAHNNNTHTNTCAHLHLRTHSHTTNTTNTQYDTYTALVDRITLSPISIDAATVARGQQCSISSRRTNFNFEYYRACWHIQYMCHRTDTHSIGIRAFSVSVSCFYSHLITTQPKTRQQIKQTAGTE